jgi:YD repeat-containing protein
MDEHALKYPMHETLRSNRPLIKGASVCRTRLRPLMSLILMLVVGAAAHATDPFYQFLGYPNVWMDDAQAACTSYANYCLNPPTDQNFCPLANTDLYHINSTTGALFSIDGIPYPHNVWCAVTSNATYTFADGTTSTQNYGPTRGAVSSRQNPAGGVFVRVQAPVRAQCGPTCNRAADPINPASGAVYDTILDSPSPSGSPAFKRFYNSTDSGGTDLSGGWRHTFSRTITPKYATIKSLTYVASADASSLYGDEGTACTSGFREIKSRVSTWQTATASYANGVCTLMAGGTSIGTLDLIYSLPSTLTPGMPLIGFDATRDDGQLISFTLQGASIVAPPTIGLKLQQTSNGYTLTDENDNVEAYDANGRLLSITSRAGVVETMNYDTSNRLSTVADSFGHSLSLTYDSQNRLSSVTRQ